MKDGIIIQARTGSTRLHNKILLPFYGEQRIIDILIANIKQACPDNPGSRVGDKRNLRSDRFGLEAGRKRVSRLLDRLRLLLGLLDRLRLLLGLLDWLRLLNRLGQLPQV